ncbi:MAG: hypothetical protein DHS20C21_08390 [Gemmatimonadota bacterium]|nr:MAG: hypothetical protein DHS20C21_08390 [Gemmatimonadota bacterium]
MPTHRSTARRHWSRALCVLPSVLALLAILSVPALAERDPDDLEELIPHHETQLERDRLGARGQAPTDASRILADSPPLAPIRNCAEWEPVTGVLIRYPLGLPYELIRDFDDHVTIHTIVSSGNHAAAISNFVANGVDTSRVQWLVRPTDSIWTRDYGPWFVFDGGGDLTIIDHVYNRPFRPNDNQVPGAFGLQQGIPVVGHDMWHTGGNYMTDGALFSMSTDLAYNEALSENGMTPSQVDALMSDYYGVAQYNVVTDISLSGIHHIDTWAKFLDEDTVLIKRVGVNQLTYGALEDRATLIGSLTASTGEPYDVHRVFCHSIGTNKPASYTNSLFLNERIYVPTFNHATRDSNALNAYRAAAPGYDVRGYPYGGWLTDDALHCRTKGILDAGMLRVAHVPIRADVEGPVLIEALVDDRSETGITAVDLRYRADGGAWTTVAMTSAGGDDWEGAIPGVVVDTNIDYYVLAADASGREEGHPRVAPAAWHSFTMLASATDAPTLRAGAAEPRAFPNPFRDRVQFSFELRSPDSIELAVYDVAGRHVRDLAQGPRAAGPHQIAWDGRDASGRRVPAGVYYFRLRGLGIQHSRPVVITR